MSDPGAHCLPPGGKGGEEKIIACRLLFSSACIFHLLPPVPLLGRRGRSTQILGGGTILRGNLRFYRKFIRGAVRASPGAEIERTSYDARNSESTTCGRGHRDSSSSCTQRRVYRCASPARIIKRARRIVFSMRPGLTVTSALNDAVIVII